MKLFIWYATGSSVACAMAETVEQARELAKAACANSSAYEIRNQTAPELDAEPNEVHDVAAAMVYEFWSEEVAVAEEGGTG